jgi:uncharacterized protein (DUF1697 family)
MSTRLVVLLRAVNLGSHNKVPMAAFRELLTALGGRDVVTYLQSGQAVVDVDDDRAAGFDDQVHDALADRFGLQIDVLTRTGAEMAAVAAANPYPHLAATPKLLHAVFLEYDPDPDLVESIGRRHGDDEFTVGDRVLYIAYSVNSRDSPLAGPLRRLPAGIATARNWTTVLALAELVARE